MQINDIVAVMPAPKKPFEAPTKDEWIGVENQLGTALPSDYKEFIQVYGTGRIDGLVWVFNPFSNNENINLLKQVKIQLNVLKELQSYGEIVPYKLFPEKNGILPFAITDNGDVLFWMTAGAPDDWTVLVNEARSPEWAAFNMPMSKFFLEILTHRLVCNVFPKSFPSAAPIYDASN